MKSTFSILFSISIIAMMMACGGDAPSGDAAIKDQEIVESDKNEATSFALTRNGITITPVEDSPEFKDAVLTLNSPDVSKSVPSGKQDFIFETKNYDLGVQTKDAGNKMCANSAKGQHIHFILNNDPYTAHYSTEIKKELPDGHHVLLSFLSRSYHESLKTADAFLLKEFNVGTGNYPDDFDENAPHLFYSRPKGTYVGKGNIEKLLLDFFIVNTTLSENGYKVKATINGTEFTLVKWVPYLVEGLPEGTVNVKLELVDKDGNTVESPFNPVERTVTLAESEPLPAN